MSAYQLIALDIDGTLLDSRKRVAPDTIEAVRQAAARGLTLVYGTGRAVSELAEFTELLPEIRYAVYASGSGIYDLREKRAFALHGIPRAQAEEIMALARPKDMMPQLVTADRDVIQVSHMDALEYFNMGIYRPMYERAMTLVPDIYAFFDACREEILKINLYHHDPAARVPTRQQLSHLPLELVYSEVSSVECAAPGVNKGTGLERLCKTLGISPAACVAVGDAENDMPMLRAAGLGVAMGNAAPHVKAAADCTVADNDHGGCAQAIRMAMGD